MTTKGTNTLFLMVDFEYFESTRRNSDEPRCNIVTGTFWCSEPLSKISI